MFKKKQKNKTKTDCFKSALNQNGGKPDSDNMSALATMWSEHELKDFS